MEICVKMDAAEHDSAIVVDNCRLLWDDGTEAIAVEAVRKAKSGWAKAWERAVWEALEGVDLHKEEEKAMAKTYFEQITASQEALAEFLASIPALDTPWDGLFQRTYCAACSAENCDAENCPHQAERNSPAWFLAQEVADSGNNPLR